MPLELIERIEKLKTTYESVADRKEKRIFQKFDDLKTVGNNGFYSAFFEKLALLKGNYKTLLQEKKQTEKKGKENQNTKKNIPPGFIRNILLIGGVDSQTREDINNGFESSPFIDRTLKSLLSDVLDKDIKRFHNAIVNKSDMAEGDLYGRMCGGALLERLMVKMLYSCTWHVNAYGYGMQPAIKITQNKKLKDGTVLSYEELEPFLFSIALEAWCYLRGWDSQDLEKRDS